MANNKREFMIWEEAGVVSFGELIGKYDYEVINPCIMICNREEEEFTDPNDGLTKKKHVMHTQFVPYTYDAIYDQDFPPVWTISTSSNVIKRGTKFRQELINLYDDLVRSTSAKK